MVTTTPKEVTDQVIKIVRQLLDEHFGDTIGFDPILVIPKIDHYGDEYLHIYVVYDCDYEKLDPGWTLSFTRLIWPRLIKIGVETLPSKSFIQKADWDEAYGSRVLESG